MKESNKLFELIKAMSPAEKGYFKKYTLIHAKDHQQVYMKLFTIISSQTEYDKKELENALRKSSLSKKIGSSNNYLYKLILKSLRAYHSDVSFSTKTMELLLDSILLKEKGLFDQANKMLEQARTSATEEEDPILLLKTQELQREINSRKSNIKVLEYNCEELYSEMLGLTDMANEDIEINQLRNKIHLLNLNYGYEPIEHAVQAQLKKTLNNPLLNVNRKHATRKLLYQTFLIRKICYSMLGDSLAAVNATKMHIAALEKDPLFHTEHFRIRYGLSLCGFLNEFWVLEIKEIEEIFKKILSIKTISLQQEIHLFIYSYSNVMGAYIHHQVADKGVILIPEIIKRLKKYQGKLSKEVLLVFQANISTLYFMISDYSNALKWMNKTLEHSDKQIRRDMYSDIRIINILIHYELKNFQLIDSLLISLERFLIKNKCMDPFSKAVIYHFKKLGFIRDKKEINEQLLLLKNELTRIFEKQKDKKSYIIAWLEKKLELPAKKMH